MRLTVLFAGILLLAACTDGDSAAPLQQSVRPAKLMTVSQTSVGEQYEFTARIEALSTIDMSFEVGGPLAELNVREGETVAKGTVIAALDPTDFQLAVREAEVQLKLARQDLQRKQRVLQENGIAKSQVEDARTNYELQQVRLSKARERLSDSRLTAPFDAYVARRYVDNFVNLNPGVPVVRLHDMTQLQVVISVPGNLVATVTPDQLVSAWVEFSFANGRRFDITLHENRGEADALAQTYEVSMLMNRPADLNILPGMTATATLQLRGEIAATTLLPASALVPTTGNGLSVWVYDPDTGQVSRRVVDTLAPVNDGVPVIGGLQPGEQIVIAGASQLQEGMQVRPLE